MIGQVRGKLCWSFCGGPPRPFALFENCHIEKSLTKMSPSDRL